MGWLQRVSDTGREVVVHATCLVVAVLMQVFGAFLVFGGNTDMLGPRLRFRSSASADAALTTGLGLAGLIAGGLVVVGLYRVLARGRTKWSVPLALTYIALLIVASVATYAFTIRLGWL